MSDDRKLAELVARALFDEEFQARLLGDPEATLRAEGVEPSPERLALVGQLDADKLKAATRKLDHSFLTGGTPKKRS